MQLYYNIIDAIFLYNIMLVEERCDGLVIPRNKLLLIKPFNMCVIW